MSNSFVPDINLSDFDYKLPKEKIAFYPLEQRDMSKLLVADIPGQKTNDFKFQDIVSLIEKDSLVIFNETKVIGARLHFLKPTGGKVELLLVEPVSPSSVPAITLSSKHTCQWECIVGGKNITIGMKLQSSSKHFELTANILSRESNKAIVEFTWHIEDSFSKILEIFGETPLPPYIEREPAESDIERYQTVYANVDGSVAAPTAGLHFTDDIINKLRNKGIKLDYLTLHIGPGTFQPVEHDDITLHEMHHEQITVSLNTINEIYTAVTNHKRIISVGTTCIRTLESLHWLGVKLISSDAPLNDFEIKQWEPYQLNSHIPVTDSLKKIIDTMSELKMNFITGKTQIIIVPGYEFKIASGLITNFHLPKSTLILLVSAFAGKEQWRKIYEHALKSGYRFLSFGDSSYLIKSMSY